MDRIVLETSESPDIQIDRIRGSLRIKGWDRSELRADTDQEDTAKIESSENLITMECDSGCMLRTPMESTFNINRVDGELMIKSIESHVSVKMVSGQVMVKSVGPLSITKVASNLNARNIEGNLECDQVSGNANLQDIEGSIKLGRVNGNLIIKGYSSGIFAESKGNATLKLDPEPGNEFSIKAGGNIICRLSADVNATIKLHSGAKNIKVSAQGTQERIREKIHEFVVGDGEGEITLDASGIIDISIPSSEDADWTFEFEKDISSVADDISQIVTEQIEVQLESLGDHLSNLTANLASISPDASDKARQKIETKRRQLERKLARIERKSSEKARQASQRARAARRFSSRYTTTSDPVSDDERKQVLQMLQNQQITVQEAEVLLAALEGREPEGLNAEQDDSETTG